MKNKLNAWAGLLLLFVTIICILAGCESSSDKSYKITLASGEGYVDDCPKSAKAGQAVKFRTLVVTDADLYVSIDGDKNFGGYDESGLYEFLMPDHDVEIDVWLESNGLAQGDSSDYAGEISGDSDEWSQDEYEDYDDDDEDEDEEEETSAPRKITGGGRFPSRSSGSGKKTEAATEKKKKTTSATTAVDPDDHDIDAYYEDNIDIYDSYEDAWEGFEDDKDAWDDY